MSESKSKPMTLKSILALVGAGLVYLVSQFLGIDLSGLTGGDAGSGGNAKPPISTPADPSPTKEIAKGDSQKESGQTLSGKKPGESTPAPDLDKPSKETSKKRDDTALIRQCFNAMRSGVQVEAEGEVVLLLPDDNDEKPHQLFLVELSNGITVKIAHNTKIAPYVPLRKGDTIRFHGEYEHNSKGGVVHWTHRTLGTRNKHPHGWLLHKGKKYE